MSEELQGRIDCVRNALQALRETVEKHDRCMYQMTLTQFCTELHAMMDGLLDEKLREEARKWPNSPL